MADLSKQRDTEDEDMEDTETPSPDVVPEEQQETAMETASEESKESPGIVKDKSDNSLDCDDATKNSTEGHVINMDIEEDDGEDHSQMSPEATSPLPPLQPEVNNKEVIFFFVFVSLFL